MANIYRFGRVDDAKQIFVPAAEAWLPTADAEQVFQWLTDIDVAVICCGGTLMSRRSNT